MATEVLSSGQDAVRRFLYEQLFPDVLNPRCGTLVNIERSFRDFLLRNGAPATLADEYAIRWKTNLVSRVDSELKDWEHLGLPRPIEVSDVSDTYVTWRHPKFHDLTGRRPLPGEFAGINEWIRKSSGREFLFVAACFLRIVGANPIFVTDTSGDRGVDLVGRIQDGPLRSIALFVQAKTSNNRIPGDRVLLEYAKFMASARSERYNQYREALRCNVSPDGVGVAYVFIANNEFKDSARKAAAELGVILRSRRQIAFWLAKRTSLEQLKLARDLIGGELKADLTNNIAPKLAF